MIEQAQRPAETITAWAVTVLVAYVFLLLAYPSALATLPLALAAAIGLVAATASAPTFVGAALVFLSGAMGLALSTVGAEVGVRVYALDGLLLLSLVGVGMSLVAGRDRTLAAPLLVPGALLFLFLTGSALHGLASGNEVRAVLGDYRRMALYPTILIVLLVALRDWEDARILLRGLITAGFATTGIELYRITRGVGYNEIALVGQTIRYLSYLEATTAALAALVLVGYSRMCLGRVRVLYLAASAPLVATVLFSNYRTMWLALSVGLVIQSLSLGWRRGLRAIAIGATVLVPAVYALVAWTPLGEYVLDRFDPLNAAASGMWRYFSWKAATDAWLDRPWFGTGLGYQHRFEYMNVESGNFVATTENTIHNDPLWFLVNNGAIGVVGLLVFALPLLRRALRLAASTDPCSRFCGSTSVGAFGLMVIVSLLQPFFSIGATMVLAALFVVLVLRSPFPSEPAFRC
jgi:O-antigen ligase